MNKNDKNEWLVKKLLTRDHYHRRNKSYTLLSNDDMDVMDENVYLNSDFNNMLLVEHRTSQRYSNINNDNDSDPCDSDPWDVKEKKMLERFNRHHKYIINFLKCVNTLIGGCMGGTKMCVAGGSVYKSNINEVFDLHDTDIFFVDNTMTQTEQTELLFKAITYISKSFLESQSHNVDDGTFDGPFGDTLFDGPPKVYITRNQYNVTLLCAIG